MTALLMPKVTANWLVDNTSLSFQQIAAFCHLHLLEVQAIADGEVSVGVSNYDPIVQGVLTWDEIHRCEADPSAELQAQEREDIKTKKKGSRYVPLAKRSDKPNGIAWLLKHHPELSDNQVCKLMATTRPTIKAIRENTHKDSKEIKAQSPIELGLISQKDLDAAIAKAPAASKTK